MTPANEARVIELLEQIAAALQRPKDPSLPALMTAEEVAQELRVDVRTMRRLRHLGELPKPIKWSGGLRWRRADIERFLQARKS